MHSPENPEKEMIQAEQSGLVPTQADSDEQLIKLWLHGRSKHTQRAYSKDALQFLVVISKPLNRVTLAELQEYAMRLVESKLQPSSIHRILSAIKSLFAFGHRLGYLSFDVAKPLMLPPLRDKLADRILEESDVQKMIILETMHRNKMILLVLYTGGFRVSELCSMKWGDLQQRDNGAGQITVFGKGGKTRTVLIPKTVWNQLMLLKGESSDQSPVFFSRKRGHLNESQIWRIVSRAAKRAGIKKAVTCHWLRHAHASHSLDRGAPIHLVQTTLGHSSISTTGRYLHARPSDSSGNYLDV